MKKLLFFGCLALMVACSSPLGDQQATFIPTLESTPMQAPQATLTPVSLTSTLIASSTVSPTSPPRFFTDPFDMFGPYWKTLTINGEASSAQFQVQNGNLVISPLSSNTWVYAIYDPYTYQNVQIDAHYQINDGSPYLIGMICQYDESTGWFEYDVSNDGTYSILFGQWLADGVAKFTPLDHDKSEYIKSQQGEYALGLGCQDSFIWLYANGKLFHKVDVSRYGLKEGKVGITVSSFDDPNMTVNVDSVEIHEP